MKAWELLVEEGKWTQHRYARDKDGLGCESSSGDACSFCTIGAINRCYGDSHRWREIVVNLEMTLKDRGLGVCIADWNDAPERKQSEVVALLKELDI